MELERPSATAVAPEAAVVRPTGEFWRHLWVPLVFAVLAHQLRQDLVFLLGALLLGCAAAAWPLCRRNLAHVTLERSVPRRARAGEPALLGYRVRNAGRQAALGIEVHEPRPRGTTPALGRLDVPCLGPGREVAGTLEATFPRRGRHGLAPAQISSRFPLGVFRVRRSVGGSDEVLVWPREGRPTAHLRQRLLARGEESERRSRRLPGGDDLVGLRDLRDGEDARRIRWRASARAGRPVVAQWQALRGGEAVLVLGGAGGDAAAFERGVSLAATVWRVLRRQGREAQLLADGAQVSSRGGGLERGLDLLAHARARAVARTAVRLRRLAASGGATHVIVVAAAGESALLSLAQAAAGRQGLVTRIPVEAAEARRWVEGLA